MCGIFGFVGRRSRAESIDLDVALKSLHHRGPDDRGTYFGVSKADPDTACAFAHTRLSIIDLSSAGRQPMTTENGRYTIVYNGEIYNHRYIRATLEKSGVVFHSNCDTEVVLQAYVRWGAESVQRLRGMFAFAIWDRDLGTLFLVRDRVGIKPLYWIETGEGIAFSSEVRVLLDVGVAERTLSREGMAWYLLFGSVCDPWTLIDRVHAFLPAHRALVCGRATSVERYWDLPVDTAPITFDDAIERVGPILRDSIASELASDVPLGIFLSGGVDSSAIAALATANASGAVHTFTVTFEEQKYNEERYAAEIAARFGCNHHQVFLPAAKALAGLESMFAAADQPSADGANTYFVSQAAREAGLVVALSGLGGDELFAGYEFFRSFAMLLRVGRIGRAVPAAIVRLIRGVHAFNGHSVRIRKMAEVLVARGCPGTTYAAIRAMFTPQQAAHLAPDLGREINDAWASLASAAGGSDSVAAFSRFELAGYLRNTLLRDSDAMSMANSIEVRVPLLDHLLIEAVLPMPGSLKLSRRLNKPLLGAAIPGFPANTARRPKMGFVLPLAEWFRGAMRDRIDAVLLSHRQSILSRKHVENLWSDFVNDRASTTFSRVWAIAAASEWIERNRLTR